MTAYAVGDLQGCLQPLKQLLTQVDFSPSRDQLWLVGDLVNRGPDSLETLRFITSLGDSAKIVLGNHDLHLLAVYYGYRKLSKKDTLSDILAADDCTSLMDWLRQQPLFYQDKTLNFCMTHAGIPPGWSIEDTFHRAAEVSQIIAGADIELFLQNMYGDKPNQWRDDIQGFERFRLITNYLTRMRFCDIDGSLDLDNKGSPDQPPAGFKPWYELREYSPTEPRILFGHWAALQGQINNKHLFALDTGCVWGGCMTLLDLNTLNTVQCDCSS